MADIFISYAHEDETRVAELVHALQEEGWSVFWDRRIPAGQSWESYIERKLNDAKCVVVVWSHQSVESKWVKIEATEAEERHVMVPVLLDHVKLPLAFRHIQAADLVELEVVQSSPEFEKLIADISIILGPPPKHFKEAEKAAEEERKRRQEEETKHKDEERRKAEEESQRLEEEKRRIAEEKRRRAEAKRKAEEERNRKEAELEAEHTRKEQFERKPESPKTEPGKEISAEAPMEEAKIAEAERSEPTPDRMEPKRKSLASRIGILIALAVVIVAGAIWLFGPGTSKPGTGGLPPQIKPEVQQETPEPKVATKTSEKSPQEIVTNSVGMEFALITAGSFTMGSRMSSKELRDLFGGETGWYEREKPHHTVRIERPFYLQTTPVTQGQWKRVMGDNPSYFKSGGDECPVENVSWENAQRFIEKLNGLEKAKVYRLPTEAEWEYACRAGTNTHFYTGDTDKDLDQAGWYSKNSGGRTHPVGEKKPNAWGLYDMHGNLWEWVEDDWHDNYGGAPDDESAWIDNPRGSYRVIAAAAGTSTLATAGRPRAAAAGPATAAASSASASPGLFPLALEPWDPWQTIVPESAMKGANSCRSEAGSV